VEVVADGAVGLEVRVEKMVSEVPTQYAYSMNVSFT
jgi:hypothetical protein